MTQKFANNARSRLIGAVSSGATSFTVESATADLFPVANTPDWLSPNDWFKATIENTLGQVEIVKVGVRSNGSAIFSNVLREQDGTTAIAFDAGATVGIRITAQDVELSLAVRETDNTFSGQNNFTGQLRQNALAARLIPVGGVIFWPFPVATIPPGFQHCDGTNGTPDMRDRFPIGARQDDAGVAKTNVTGALTSTGGTKDAVVVDHLHNVNLTSGGQSTNHTHPGSTSSAGAHVHGAAAGQFSISGNAGFSYGGGGSSLGLATNTASAGDHTHTVTVGIESSTHTHNVTGNTAGAGVSGVNQNLPPYYAGCWIQAMPYA